MFDAPSSSKAPTLPELEAPTFGECNGQYWLTGTPRCIEITGVGEGSLSLARLSRGKYVALIVVGVLAVIQSCSLLII